MLPDSRLLCSQGAPVALSERSLIVYTERIDTYWKAFTVPLQNTLKGIISFVPRFMVASVLFLLFLLLAHLFRRGLRRGLEKNRHIPWAVKVLMSRLAYLVMLLIGLLVALSAADVNVTTVITSLGVAGFALGFALKEILENFIAGILLLFARPFEVGDQVTLGSYEGTVKDIEIRTTTLRTYSDEIVLIPNSSVYTNPVVNHTRLGHRRYAVDFDTSLKADTDLVEREALRTVTENPDVMSEPAPFLRIVRISSGNDVVSWRLNYWAEAHKAVEIKTISDTLERIKRAMYDAGVPTPTSTSATILQRPERAQPADGRQTLSADL